MTRHRMSSHGPVDDIRVTVRIDSGGDVVHEIQDRPRRTSPSRRHARVFDQSEARAFRKMLVAGGYPGSVNETEPGSCSTEFITLQSCVEGRYYGRATTCGKGEPASLSGLADAIEGFALGSNEAAKE